MAPMDDMQWLSRVNRPSRYVASLEAPCAGPPGGAAAARAVIVVPELYEQAVGRLELRLLWNRLCRLEGWGLDLAFAAGADLAAHLGRRAEPPWSLFAKRPLAEHDLLIVLLTHELQAPALLTLLRLAGIPWRSAERDAGRGAGPAPFLLGCGPGLANPEPFAPFLDAVAVGDAEEGVPPAMRELPAGADWSRDAERFAAALAGVPGIYLPACYESREGRAVPRSSSAGVPARVTRRWRSGLAAAPEELRPFVPLADVEADFLALEVQRGCAGACGDCGPPRRDDAWDPGAFAGAADGLLGEGGWEELSLAAPLVSDEERLHGILAALAPPLAARGCAVSLPVLRPRAASARVLETVSALRRVPLHLSARWPEDPDDDEGAEELAAAVAEAARRDWRAVHLRLHMGAPGDGPGRWQQMARAVRRAASAGRGGRLMIVIHLEPVAARAHTRLERDAQADAAALRAAISGLRARAQGPRVRVRWGDADAAEIAAVLARGDRSLAEVIEEAWRRGARSPSRGEPFQAGPWREALEACGRDPLRELAARPEGSPLPWDHLEMRLPAPTSARAPECHILGVPDPAADPAGAPAPPRARPRLAAAGERVPERKGGEEHGRAVRRRAPAPVSGLRLRLAYAVEGDARFLSHLDVVRLFARILRRSGLPIAWSQGHAPHPRIAFGPPRAVGMSSRAEYADIVLEGPYTEEEDRRLRAAMPPGIGLLRTQPLYGPRRSIEGTVNCGLYAVRLFHEGRADGALEGRNGGLYERVERFAALPECRMRRSTPKGEQEVDLRGTLVAQDLETDERGGVALRFLARMGGQGRARPAELAAALLGMDPGDPPAWRIERWGLFQQDAGGVLRDPFGERHEVSWVMAVGGTAARPGR